MQEFLRDNNDLDLSVKGISDALLRVGDACKNEYIGIQNRIRRSKWVHIDETGFHVNGEKFWRCAFRSAENDVLITVVDSRGRDVVVKDTLGGRVQFSSNSGRMESVFLSQNNTEMLGPSHK